MLRKSSSTWEVFLQSRRGRWDRPCASGRFGITRMRNGRKLSTDCSQPRGGAARMNRTGRRWMNRRSNGLLRRNALKIVICGLSITSSWGNGHATTFRALARALHARGHKIVFFERDVEWYASNRDLPDPNFCRVELYESWETILPKLRVELNEADVAMVGSYFADGIQAVNEMCDSKARSKTFYDIDTPITIAKMREHGKSDYLTADQIPEFDVFFSFTGGPMLLEIEQRFGARHAVPLYCSFDPERYHRRPLTKRFACDLSYMGTYA